MNFNVKSPCQNCPFRRDVRGYLRGDRAREIADGLEGDDQNWFACHETTTKPGRSVRDPKAAQCAGAMILQTKLGRVNVAMRMAYVLGLLKPGGLRMDAPVFDTYEEFVKHHKLKRG